MSTHKKEQPNYDVSVDSSYNCRSFFSTSSPSLFRKLTKLGAENLVLSTELMMQIGHRMFRASALPVVRANPIRWPMYIINFVDKIKFSYTTPSLTHHCSF